MTTTTRLPEWEGVYNGEEFTVEEKAAERNQHGMPQPIADDLSSYPEGAMLGTIWFMGGIDLRVHDGEVQFNLTPEQFMIALLAGADVVNA